MANTNLESVIAETERDLHGVRSRLKVAMSHLAEELEYYARALGEGGYEVSKQGIIRDKGTEIDTLCARYFTLKETVERLQWLKSKEEGK